MEYPRKEAHSKEKRGCREHKKQRALNREAEQIGATRHARSLFLVADASEPQESWHKHKYKVINAPRVAFMCVHSYLCVCKGFIWVHFRNAYDKKDKTVLPKLLSNL